MLTQQWKRYAFTGPHTADANYMIDMGSTPISYTSLALPFISIIDSSGFWKTRSATSVIYITNLESVGINHILTAEIYFVGKAN
jgi:hypothetical protein